MGKNPDDQGDKPDGADDTKEVSEADLRALKYPEAKVETAGDEPEEDEDAEGDDNADDTKDAGDDDGKTDDAADSEEDEDDSNDDSADDDSEAFVKQFPNIKGDNLEEYARALEQTIVSSNTEGKRLSDRVKELEAQAGDKTPPDGKSDKAPKGTVSDDPRLLYVDSIVNRDIQTAFTEFSKTYPQVRDEAEYAKFNEKVKQWSKFILSEEKRAAPAEELFSKAAVELGWQPDEKGVTSKDRLKVAIKDRASFTKTSSTTKKVPKSKVTPQMLAVDRLMYPEKSEEQSRKELEPHIQ